MWFTLHLTVQPCFHDNVYLPSLYQAAMVEVDLITVATVVMEEAAEVVADMETRVEATVAAAVAMITTTVVVEAATLEEVSYRVNILSCSYFCSPRFPLHTESYIFACLKTNTTSHCQSRLHTASETFVRHKKNTDQVRFSVFSHPYHVF